MRHEQPRPGAVLLGGESVPHEGAFKGVLEGVQELGDRLSIGDERPGEGLPGTRSCSVCDGVDGVLVLSVEFSAEHRGVVGDLLCAPLLEVADRVARPLRESLDVAALPGEEDAQLRLVALSEGCLASIALVAEDPLGVLLVLLGALEVGAAGVSSGLAEQVFVLGDRLCHLAFVFVEELRFQVGELRKVAVFQLLEVRVGSSALVDFEIVEFLDEVLAIPAPCAGQAVEGASELGALLVDDGEGPGGVQIVDPRLDVAGELEVECLDRLLLLALKALERSLIGDRLELRWRWRGFVLIGGCLL